MLKVKMKGPTKINLKIVKIRFNFSCNSSIVSSLSVIVYIKDKISLKYDNGTKIISIIIKKLVKIKAIGKYKIRNINSLYFFSISSFF